MRADEDIDARVVVAFELDSSEECAKTAQTQLGRFGFSRRGETGRVHVDG